MYALIYLKLYSKVRISFVKKKELRKTGEIYSCKLPNPKTVHWSTGVHLLWCLSTTFKLCSCRLNISKGMQTVNLCVMRNAYFCPTTWLEQTLKLNQIKYANTSMWGCKLWLGFDCSPISDIRWLILCGRRSVASTHLRALCLPVLAYMPSAYTLNIVHIGFKLFIFNASLLYVILFITYVIY